MCFGSSNIRHAHPGNPAVADETTVCPSVLVQSHLETFSVASVVFLITLLLAPPAMPSSGMSDPQISCSLLALFSIVSDVHIWSSSFHEPPPSDPAMAMSPPL